MSKPIFGTKEWASSNENIMFGCHHGCLYCYGKSMSIRHKRIDIKNWEKPILRRNQLDKRIGKRNGTIMFPTTHDLHPEFIIEIVYFLDKLLHPGNKVLIVSKPHFEVIKAICDQFYKYKGNILFRFTIGSSNDEILKFWEPGAPSFSERFRSLQFAYSHGFKTSVSCEPMLDPNIYLVVDACRKYISDSVWLGRMNDARRRFKNNTGSGNIPAQYLDGVTHWYDDQKVKNLYSRYKLDPLIRWKGSLKKTLGLELPTEKGLDV